MIPVEEKDLMIISLEDQTEMTPLAEKALMTVLTMIQAIPIVEEGQDMIQMTFMEEKVQMIMIPMVVTVDQEEAQEIY